MKSTLSTTLFIGALLSISLAAPAEEETSETLDQIVVTGARTPLDRNRLGSASSVISRQMIERRQLRYVSDLLRSVPGFSVSHTGVTGTQTQVRVRGAEANHVLVLIDGVRANDPATGDEFRWEYLQTGDIERIEIIRGPQSALWGSEAIGAVVQIITRRDAAHGKLDGYAEGGVNHTVNAGLKGIARAGYWALGAGFESYDTDGANVSRTGNERDGSELSTGSLTARYANERLSIDAGLRRVDALSQTDPVDFFTTGLPTDGDRETRSDNLIGNIGAALRALQDRVTYRAKAQYFDSKHRNFANGLDDISTASTRLALTLQSDIQLSDNVLSLALERESSTFEQRGEVGYGDPNQDQDLSVSSAIAEYQHLANDRLSWILSARFDAHSDFDDVLTGKASMAYQWTDTTRLRGSVGSGQKTPTFIERFGYYPGQFTGNPDLKPETSLSVEAGIDQLFFSDALSLQVTLFAQELDDEINGFVYVPATFSSTAENRSDSSKRRGAEIAASWRLSDWLDFAASYTYTDSTDTDPDGSRIREIRRPKHAGSISFDIAPEGSRYGLALSADYGGSRDDVFYPPYPEPSRAVILTSYWLVDLTAQFRLREGFTLFARGSNLLDENYEQVFGYRTLGRAVYAGLRVEFGGD